MPLAESRAHCQWQTNLKPQPQPGPQPECGGDCPVRQPEVTFRATVGPGIVTVGGCTGPGRGAGLRPVSYTHLRAHETEADL
eukprot:2796042-Rhodomonas_salina.2